MSVIYKLYSNEAHITECYIGSTTDIKNRMRVHKHYSKVLNNKLYKYMRNFEWHNFTYDILETINDITRTDLIKLERKHHDLIKPSLNNNTPARPYNEYYAANKDKIKQMVSKKIHCDCGANIRSDYMSKHLKTKRHNKAV